MDAYVPDKKHVTGFFLRDLINNKRKVSTFPELIFQIIPNSKVRNVNVPNYHGLDLQNFFSMCEKSEVVLEHMPEKVDWNKLPRQW